MKNSSDWKTNNSAKNFRQQEIENRDSKKIFG
jgi:hypothetical protein